MSSKSASGSSPKNLGFWPLVVASAAFLWSLDAFLRTSLYALPPVLVSFWEHFLGLFLIFPLFWGARHEVKKLTRKEWSALSFIGFIAGPVGLILYLYALTQTSFANFSIVVLLQQTQPIWAILAAALLVRERITGQFVGLAVIAMIGVYLIVFPNLYPNFETGTATPLAGLLALMAAFAWGTATSMGKYVLQKVNFGTVVFLRFALATGFSLLLFVGFSLFQQMTGAEAVFGNSYSLSQMFALTRDQWISLIMVVCITGAAAMMLYYYGLKRVPARVATIMEMTWPASSLIIGVMIFKNTFTTSQVIGIIILLVSMFLITRTQKEGDIVIPEREY